MATNLIDNTKAIGIEFKYVRFLLVFPVINISSRNNEFTELMEQLYNKCESLACSY